MKRLFYAFAIIPLLFAPSANAGSDQQEIKEALQQLQDFIGEWKGSGSSRQDGFWTETMQWGWRFKNKKVWLEFEIPKGKHYKSGKLEYLLDDDAYRVTMVDKKDMKTVFNGKLRNKRLNLESIDAKTKRGEKIVMNLAGGGVRLVYTYYEKPANRTLFFERYQVAMTKKGESFATAKNKGRECVVTGGLGTMAVSFKGATYYVCCSGCRDAFNENPEKILKEYNERKKKKRR